MIFMVAGDMTPTLVPIYLAAIALIAIGLVAIIALIVREERLRVRAHPVVGMHRLDRDIRRIMADATPLGIARREVEPDAMGDPRPECPGSAVPDPVRRPEIQRSSCTA